MFPTEHSDAEPIQRVADDGTITVTDNHGNVVTVEPSTKESFIVAKALIGASGDLKALEAQYADKVQERKDLQARIEETMKLLGDMRRADADMEQELRQYNLDKRRLAREIATLRLRLQQAIDNELKSQRLVDNAIQFEKRIAEFSYSGQILQHQKEGAYILATNQRCILGDKRGAGKSLTAIASWDMTQAQKVLVIVPDDVVGNFVNEIRHWAPHRTVFQLGKQTRTMRHLTIAVMEQLTSFVAVLNYSAWRKDRDLLTSLSELCFDTIVMDEAHEIKNTGTSAYQGVKQLVMAENSCPKCGLFVKSEGSRSVCLKCGWTYRGSDHQFLDRMSVKNVIPMSGTVILNKPQDLYALLSLVDPENFTSEARYLNAYCEQDYYSGKWGFRPGGLESLKTKLSGKFIAREGVATPGQTIYYHDLEIDPNEYPEQFKVIEQLSKHAQILLKSGEKTDIFHTISLITRKRQANVWPAGIVVKDDEGIEVFRVGDEVTESIKLDKLIGMNDGELTGLIPEFTENGDMELGSRVVVFSQFKGPLAELERRLTDAGISCVRFDGDTPQHIRDMARIDFDRKFCDQPGYEKVWQVILCNYKTGGVGLNFTGATETIILDREWNPGKEDQAFGRTDRLGQTEHTNVHIVRIEKTIDVWLDNLIEEKQSMIAGFNKVTEPLSTQLFEALRKGEIL